MCACVGEKRRTESSVSDDFHGFKEEFDEIGSKERSSLDVVGYEETAEVMIARVGCDGLGP